MRFPKRKLRRAVVDDHVDRADVEAGQLVKLTATNSPFGLTIKFYCEFRVEKSQRLKVIPPATCGLARQYSTGAGFSSGF